MKKLTSSFLRAYITISIDCSPIDGADAFMRLLHSNGTRQANFTHMRGPNYAGKIHVLICHP